MKKQSVTGELTHFDRHGQAWMVDVGEKTETRRLARAARAKVVSRYTWDKVAGEMHGILQRATTSSPALRAH